METTENNKLIAEFMGVGKHYEAQSSNMFNQYHESWDRLMPVVEKIEILGYKFEKNYQPIDKDWQSLIVKGNDILYQEFSKNSLNSSYYVVVKFIKEYNKKN